MSDRCPDCYAIHGDMVPAVHTNDWKEIFKCFDGATREEVAEVLAAKEGSRGGSEWLMLGRLKDGRYFFVKASCDYTGWG